MEDLGKGEYSEAQGREIQSPQLETLKGAQNSFLKT